MDDDAPANDAVEAEHGQVGVVVNAANVIHVIEQAVLAAQISDLVLKKKTKLICCITSSKFRLRFVSTFMY